jgi:ABC-type multidrug transport system ATPase subunit
MVLQVQGLKKHFGKTKAVDGISFVLGEGQVVGLLGPNGAGKTTTLKCISGLLRKDEGSVTVGGLDHRDDRARYRLAYIPETPDIYEMLTVWEHMKFIALAYSLIDWEKEADELLERFDLAEKRGELGMHLSKGMKQKITICCALLHHPDVLLFDEPLIGLDPKAVRELKNAFYDLKDSGKTLLISTHMLDTAQNLCDSVLVMKQGELIAEGTIEELRQRMRASADSTLEDLFLEVTADDQK